VGVDAHTPASVQDLLARALRLVESAGGRRVLLGVSGAPGSGKSTLASYLVRALQEAPPPGMPAGTWVVQIPMDGFHLADVELARLGLLDRKGAPETFDGAGYAALLGRVAADDGHRVYAPAFERDIEQPVAGAIPVAPEVRLVVTEGNYLLLDTPPWSTARSLLTEVWHCEPDEERRVDQLVARHTAYGKSPEEARAWALGPDQTNARLVRDAARHADLVVGPALLRELPVSR
jgi:pantothenate kinase